MVGNSCWANDNKYEIYEIPKKTNKSAYRFTGDFIVLAKNTSFDYWVLATLKLTLDSNFNEKAFYRPYGQYTVATSGKDFVVRKNIMGRNVIFGGTSMISEIYDAYNTRKKVYGFNSEKMLSFKNNFRHTPGNVSGGDKVKIYKKKKVKKSENTFYTSRNKKKNSR